MSRPNRTSKASLTLVLACLCSTATAALPPIEAFGRKPALVDVDINPAGTRLAWIEDDGRTAHIVIHDVATGKTLRRVTTPPHTKLWSIAWANDETVLVNESMTRTIRINALYTNEWQRWVALDVSGGDNRMLLMNDGNREWVTGVDLLRRRTATPNKIFMSTWDWSSINQRDTVGSRLRGGRGDDGWTHNAYEVDIGSGTGKKLAEGTAFTRDWLIDDAGKLIVRSEYNPKYDEFGVFLKVGSSWRLLYNARKCGGLGLVGFSADKRVLVARGRTCAQERQTLWSLPLDGSVMRPLLDDDALEVDSVVLDPHDRSVLGAMFVGIDHPWRWLDPEAERRIGALQKSFGVRGVSVVSRSADNQRVVALVDDHLQPPIYYLVDYAAKKADIINEAYPQLAGVKLGSVTVFRYTARDDYALAGYLTLPPDAAGGRLPLVVMPHGGPESRDDSGFDWLAQFLASRGYAVFQPQFRGSTGLGRAHADAGRRQWGLRMQDDVTDGARALIEQGIADPKRICIVGWSYGGYSALAGAAFTPDLYACAVSVAGIADLPQMIGWDARNGRGRESDTFAYWRDHIGPATDPQVIAKSPARAAEAIRAPVLLIHGTDDSVVPISQSRLMARVLKQLDKPVELVELPGEDHWMRTSSASRVRTLSELERFLGKYLAVPQTTTATAAN